MDKKDYQITLDETKIMDVAEYPHIKQFGVKKVITFYWSGNIGFGEFQIFFNNDGTLSGDSESMCNNDDKDFLLILLKQCKELSSAEKWDIFDKVTF